eukprot:1306700-Pyramimonas_sp.AAC.1
MSDRISDEVLERLPRDKASIYTDCVALSWATLWAIQSDVYNITYWSDSTSAIRATQFLAHTRSDVLGIGTTSRALTHISTRAGYARHASHEHVSAHTGHPVNEMADTLAALASLGLSCPPEQDILSKVISQAESLQWAWLEPMPSDARA